MPKTNLESKDIEQIKAHLKDVAYLGHFPLIKESLTEDDWGEVWRAYVAFQHQLRLIVLKVRRRSK